MESTTTLMSRLEALGLHCDHISLDRVTSATAALACFPMYMVANAHLWSPDRSARPRLLRLPTPESVREAFAIGRQEASWDMEPEHRQVLGSLLQAPKPSDRAVYEYALETLEQILSRAGDAMAETLRNGVARMIVAVAHASGDGVLGTGEPVSPEERACILRIAARLGLEKAEAAAWLLEQFAGPERAEEG